MSAGQFSSLEMCAASPTSRVCSFARQADLDVGEIAHISKRVFCYEPPYSLTVVDLAVSSGVAEVSVRTFAGIGLIGVGTAGGARVGGISEEVPISSLAAAETSREVGRWVGTPSEDADVGRQDAIEELDVGMLVTNRIPRRRLWCSTRQVVVCCGVLGHGICVRFSGV